MPQTPKMGLVSPSEGDEPYFDLINSLFTAIDSSLFAGREDRNLFFMNTASITVTIPGGGGPGTADIFWSSPLVLKGFEGFGRVDVDVPGGPLTLIQGQALYVEIPRPAQTDPVLVTALVGDYITIQRSDAKIVLAVFWTDGKMYFRNGASIGGSGGSFPVTLQSREEGFVAAPAQASFLLVGSGGGTQFPVDTQPFHILVHKNGIYEPNVNVGLATTVFTNDTVNVAWLVPPAGGEDIRIAYAYVP